MMKIDGRESAKCQKSKLGDIDDIIEIVLNYNKTKLCIVSSLTSKRKRSVGGGGFHSELKSLVLKRESVASL